MLNNVTRWNPAAAAYLTREPFSRLFDTFFNDLQGEEVSNRSWVPPWTFRRPRTAISSRRSCRA